ncbi:MAG: S1C family serine protease, partial [Proteobacteria bacterium]|nr:S1C family serine protease [Pseudomonadota bacterium]
HILTIGYIVTEADAIEVTTQKGRTVPAVLQAYDHATGFALLQARAPLDVTPVALGDSAALALREPVMVLPAGGREAASIAYVVSKRTFTGGWEYLLDTAIFTSPPTMQWAGAALINHDGKLVGIGSLLVRDSVEAGTPLPGNMFVPIDTVKPILADLIDKGRRSGPVQPWLGMSTEEAQGRLFVTRVSPGGPAERAGVQRGDLVLGVGSTAVKSLEEFYRSMWAIGSAGVEVPLKLLQGPDLREVRVRSMDRLDYFREKPAL